MKKIIALILVILCLPLGAGALTKEYNFKGFDEIVCKNSHFSGRISGIAGRFEITVVKSSSYKTTLEVSDADAELFKVSLSGKTLVLEYGHTKGVKSKIVTPTAKIRVQMPSLKLVSLSGNSILECSGGEMDASSFSMELTGATKASGLNIRSSSSDIEISGSSKLENSRLVNKSAEIDLSGASVVNSLTIESANLDLNCSGSSRFGGRVLGLSDAELDASGASKIAVDLISIKNGLHLGIDASGSSLVEADCKNPFKGNDCELESSGAASVRVGGESFKSCQVSASGSSKINAGELIADVADVEITGAARVSVYASESLVYEAGLSTKLDYFGRPKTVINKNKSSNVTAH